VTRIIKRLKKEKSQGVDNLLNEYFIIFDDYLTTYFVKRFNIVFQSGIFPSIWSEGIKTPVLKKEMSRIAIITVALLWLVACQRFLQLYSMND
jgi:hypothetical protein